MSDLNKIRRTELENHHRLGWSIFVGH